MSDWLDNPGHADCPSAPTLDSYLLGELPEGEQTELARHIEDCPQCASRLQGMASFSAPGAESRIEASLNEAKRPRRWFDAGRGWRAALAVAAAVAIVVLVPKLFSPTAPAPPRDRGTDPGPTVRLKGAAVPLVFYRLDDGQPVALAPEAPLAVGETLQAAVASDAAVHVALVDVDGLSVAPVSPLDGQAVPVVPGKETPLEPAFTLESIVAGEVLWLVVCPQSFVLSEVPRHPDKLVRWQETNGCDAVVRQLADTGATQ